MFDHKIWAVQAVNGVCRRAEIQLGECLLLFTSLDSLHAYLDCCEDRELEGLRPVVFSKNRKEFGIRARRSAQEGCVGALFDPAGGNGEAPFLPFSKISSRKAHTERA